MIYAPSYMHHYVDRPLQREKTDLSLFNDNYNQRVHYKVS